MPGCSSPPVISASATNRWRLTGSSACFSSICFSATSRCSSQSSARTPRRARPAREAGASGTAGHRRSTRRPPKCRCGRGRDHRRRRWPGRSGRAIRASVASISGSPRSAGPAGGLVRGDGGQALLHVATVRFDVDRREGLEDGPLRARQVAACFEVVGQAFGFVAGPGLKSGDQGALVDQAVLSASNPKRRWRSAAAVMECL